MQIGRIAFREQYVARLDGLARHEGLQPLHREIALGGEPHLLDQPQHLPRPDAVEGQQDHVDGHAGVEAHVVRVEQRYQIGDDADAAQRDDGFHRAAGNGETGGEPADRFDPGHVHLSFTLYAGAEYNIRKRLSAGYARAHQPAILDEQLFGMTDVRRQARDEDRRRASSLPAVGAFGFRIQNLKPAPIAAYRS